MGGQKMKLMRRLSPDACMVKDASCIAIAVILKHYSTLKASLVYKSILGQQVHTILVNSIVVHNSEVDLENSKLAAAYGITNIEILKCQINDSTDITTACRVMHRTKVKVQCVNSVDFFHLKSYQEPVLLGGLQQELQHLKSLLALNKISDQPVTQRTVGVLLHGPPGCGKTSLCKALSYSGQAVLLSVDASDLLKAEFGSGAEALAKIFSRAKVLSTEGSVILFIDELDMLCPHPKTASLGNRQVTSALISEMDKLHSCCVPGLLVIAATNAISHISPSLRRPGCFGREILLNVPSRKQRLDILKVHTDNFTVAADVSLAGVADMTVGYVGDDLQALCLEALNIAEIQDLQDHQVNNPKVKMSHFSSAMYKISPSLKKGLSCHVELQPVFWDDIGGLNDIKAEIKQSIEWPLLYPEALIRMDLAATKGVLLYGPPGCCKTTLVRAAATSCNVTFLALSGAQVYSPYVGESERIISEAFQKARALAPAILFFDEVDSLVGKRSSAGGQSRVQERILATMLNEMDGIGIKLDMKTTVSKQNIRLSQTMILSGEDNGNDIQRSSKLDDVIGNKVSDPDMTQVIVIGATNRPDMLDPAILRPGRLDRLIYVPPPDMEGRKSILRILVSKMATAEVDINHIGACTEFFSGADLKNLCREAALTAIRDNKAKGQLDLNSLTVNQENFIKALETVKPSLSSKILQQYS